MTTIDLRPAAAEQTDPHEQVRLLEARLDRERARNAGLERGVAALSDRVDALRSENLELRRRLEVRGR